MATVEIKKEATSRPRHLAERYDLRTPNVMVGDLVAVLNNSGSYDIARISSRTYSNEDNFQIMHYRIKVIAGEQKGAEFLIVEGKPKDEEQLNIGKISTNPQADLDKKGSGGTILVDRLILEFALQDNNIDMLADRLALVLLTDEGERTHAIVELLGSFSDEKGVRVSFLATAPSSKKLRPHIISVPKENFLDNGSYELLK